MMMKKIMNTVMLSSSVCMIHLRAQQVIKCCGPRVPVKVMLLVAENDGLIAAAYNSKS